MVYGRYNYRIHRLKNQHHPTSPCTDQLNVGISKAGGQPLLRPSRWERPKNPMLFMQSEDFERQSRV